MDASTILMGFYTAGLVLAFNGAVQLAVRNKTGVWKEGGANLVTGGIVAGVAIILMVWLVVNAVISK